MRNEDAKQLSCKACCAVTRGGEVVGLGKMKLVCSAKGLVYLDLKHVLPRVIISSGLTFKSFQALKVDSQFNFHSRILRIQAQLKQPQLLLSRGGQRDQQPQFVAVPTK